MTGITPMGSGGIQGVQAQIPSSGGNPRLKALEKKLAQLKDEKEKAVKNKDRDKAKKLEEEIQKVEREIEQLKRKEKKKNEEEGSKEEKNGYGQMPSLGNVGMEIDVYA